MLCESRLWTVVFCQDWDGPSAAREPTPVVTATTTSGCAPVPVPAPVPASPRVNTRTLPSPRQQCHPHPHPHTSPRQRFPAESPRLLEPTADAQACRLASPGLDVPGRVTTARSPPPAPAEPFLVPPSCRSICQDYSDLRIAGDQVLLLGGAQDVGVGVEREREREVLLLPWGEEAGALGATPERDRERERERQPERERPSLAVVERPLSDAQLNRYLEQKLLELYRQHLTQGPPTHWPAHTHAHAHTSSSNTPHAGLECPPGPPGPPPLLLASELLQCSLDQITLQLRRQRRHLEAEQAKDMVMSCLLRVASSLQSGEISTPVLQISTETTQ